ncbi:hypothetical protein HPMBJEAJ_00342 [Aeromonas phage avDM6]|nr:hypothetical protein HPMBJEAJ_00342 [Aeromonas phage avDM6]
MKKEMTFEDFCDKFLFQVADRNTMHQMDYVICDRRMNNLAETGSFAYNRNGLDTDLIKMMDMYYASFTHFLKP